MLKTCSHEGEKDPNKAKSFGGDALNCREWDGHGEIIGMSPRITRVIELIERIAHLEPGSAGELPTVLLLGETGTGKELGMEGLVHNTELKSVFVSTE